HRGADAGWAAVEAVRPAAGVGDVTKLGGQHDLVPAALDSPADEFLVVVRAVELGGVQEGDAEVEGPVDGADGFRLLGGPVAPRHSPRAKADAGDLEGPQAGSSHGVQSIRAAHGARGLGPGAGPVRAGPRARASYSGWDSWARMLATSGMPISRWMRPPL